MNPRVLTPYKVLAVAALSAGCVSSPRGEPPAASTSAATPPPDDTAPAAPAAPAPEPDTPDDATPEIPPASAQAAASGDAAHPRGPRADAARSLDALRDELEADGDALARVAHYRPLCDARGYPLVGNVIRKGPSPRVQPSALCASVRTRSARR